MADGKSIARCPLKGGPESMCVHPIDGWVAVTIDYRFQRLNARTLQPLRSQEGQPHSAGASEFTPDGRFLVLESARTLQLWDSEVIERTQSLRAGSSDLSHDAMITNMAISPNNLWLGSSSRGAGNVRLWELMSGQMIAELVIGAGECNVRFSPDSRYFAVLGEKETYLFEMRLPVEQTMMALTTWPIDCMALHPNGHTLATGTSVSGNDLGEIALWPVSEQPSPPLVRAAVTPWDRGGEHRMAFTATGNRLGLTHSETESVSIWDLITSKSRRTVRLSNCGELVRGPGHQLWGAFEHKILAINTDDGSLEERLNNRFANVVSGKGTINGIALNNDSVLSAGRDGNLRIMPLAESGAESSRVINVSAAQLRRVAWLSKQQAIVTDDSGGLHIIDLADGRIVAEQVAHTDRVDVLRVSGNGIVATSGPDGVVQIGEWDGKNWRPLFRVRYPQAVMDAVFHPDGVRLLIRLRSERGVRVLHLDRLRDRLNEFGLATGLEAIRPLPSSVTTMDLSSMKPLPPHEPIPSNGLWCEVFEVTTLSRPLGTHYDETISFNWKLGAPKKGMSVDHFGLRWTGWLKVPKSGKYTFHLNADDRARFWLDEKLVLDVNQCAMSAEVELDDQPHHVRVEYSELTGDARVQWSWSQLDGFAEQVVPKEVLFPVKPK